MLMGVVDIEPAAAGRADGHARAGLAAGVSMARLQVFSPVFLVAVVVKDQFLYALKKVFYVS